MKKTYFLFFIALALISIVSCSFKEEIYINADGSGNIAFSVDASQLMQMAGDEFGDSEKTFDSIINFKTLLSEKRDSIAGLPKDQQEKLKALENFKMHMVMKPEESQMAFTLMTDFEDASELKDMFSKMSELQGLGDSPKDAPTGLKAMSSNETTNVSYSFKNNVFKRNAKIVDEDLLQKQLDSIGEMEMFFKSSTYILEYHFFKPVKSVTDPTAMFSQDRKTVTIEKSFMNYTKSPEVLNVEFVLED